MTGKNKLYSTINTLSANYVIIEDTVFRLLLEMATLFQSSHPSGVEF